MSTTRPVPSDVAVHEFVQLLAGWVPDEELAAVRRRLASQPAVAAAAAVAMVVEHDVPLTAEGVETARSLAGEPGALDDVQPVARYPRLPFFFSAYDPHGGLERDDLDQVMAEAAQARRARIAGVWRAWRLPQDGSGEPAAGDQSGDPGQVHRVYLVQVPGSAAAPGLAGELQAALDGLGDAGVEVIALDTVLRPYQAAALEGSAMLWVAQDEAQPSERDEGPPFKIARVFDFAKPDTGPGFHPGHRMVTDSAERDRLLQYLASGTLVLHTTARARDVLDPDAGQVVPTSFRTDGEWIWTDTVAYYLEQHGLAPDDELAAHIDARWQAGDADAETDGETAVAAATFLLYPPPKEAREAAWTAGANG
jgi:hypothetical protein